MKEEIEDELKNGLADLKPEEAAVLGLLEARLKRTLTDKLKDSVETLDKDAKKSANGRRPGKKARARA